MNTTTEPTPEMMPSVSKSRSKLAGISAFT